MAETPAEFVLHEARLLDSQRYDEWLALFAAEGRYWVPLLGVAQVDTTSCNSIALEDSLLLALRVARLKDPRAHSQHPRSSCQHVLQQPELQQGPDAGVVRVSTPFLYVESRQHHPVMLSGTYAHALRPNGSGGWVILEKRVNLLDPTQPLPAIQLFI